MKSITLHLVVAGATYFNQLDRFQGWSGTPLTATGEQATAKVAQQLASTTFDTAFASDTSRAIQTARIILDSRAQPVKLRTVVALRAPFYGGFEGTERAAVWSGFATKLGYQSVAAFAADQTPVSYRHCCTITMRMDWRKVGRSSGIAIKRGYNRLWRQRLIMVRSC